MAAKKTVAKKTTRPTKSVAKSPVRKTPTRKTPVRKSHASSSNSNGIFNYFKFGESYTSLILGMVVVIIATILLVAFFKNRGIQEVNPRQDISATSTLNNNQKIYIVKDGDTLWSIAASELQDGYSWTEIMRANNIKDPGNIEKGTRLIIPNTVQSATGSAAQAQPTPTPTTAVEPTVVATATAMPSARPTLAPTKTMNQDQESVKEQDPSSPYTDKITGNTYIVKEDDYLWEIALRAYGDGYKWVDIARNNNLLNPDVIHKGNVLKLPR